MKKIYNTIAVLLLIIFTGCSQKQSGISKAVAHPLQEEQLKSRQLTNNVTEYSRENTEAYKRSDGKTVIYLYSSAIEATGNLIEPKEDGGFLSDGNYFSKDFPQQISPDHGIQIGHDSNFIKILPFDDGEYPGEICERVNAFGQERQAVVYQNAIAQDKALYCYPTAFGVNTEIIISKRSETAAFRMKIQLPNLAPDTGSPDYILLKDTLQKGEVRSILYTPLAVDANGKWSYANAVKLIEKDSAANTYTVEYTVDQEFLQDKSTKYPITLNQSLHLYKPKQPDTSAYEKTGDEAGHYLSPYMLLGDQTIKGEGWTFIRYETLNLLNIDPEKVVSANYVFRNLFDLEKETKIGAYAVTADWCSINTRWFNRPPFDEKPLSEVIIQKAGDYELDITALLKEMLKNKGKENAKYSVQNSFLIRSDTKDSNMIFASGDNGLFSPLLEIVLSE